MQLALFIPFFVWVYTFKRRWVGNLTLLIMLVLDTAFGIYVVNKY